MYAWPSSSYLYPKLYSDVSWHSTGGREKRIIECNIEVHAVVVAGGLCTR